jgi:DTW domain-containing protein YfiP
VASLCLAQAGEPSAAQALDAHLEVFTRQYLRAKNGWIGVG